MNDPHADDPTSEPLKMTFIPLGLLTRLTDHAHKTLSSELRYIDRDTAPAEVLERFLATRAGGPGRSLLIPSAEPGDLLVKLERAETWQFSVEGWRELAPVYRVGGLAEFIGTNMPDDEEETETFGILEPDVIVLIEQGTVVSDFPSWAKPVFCKAGTLHNVGGLVVIRRDEQIVAHPESLDVDQEIDRIVAEGGKVRARAGYDWPMADGFPRPIPDFDDAARHARIANDLAHEAHMRRARDLAQAAMKTADQAEAWMGAQGAGFISESGIIPPSEPFHPLMQESLDELLKLQREIDSVLEAAADVDLGRGDKTLRAFSDGIDSARKIVLTIATRGSRPQGVG